MASPDASSAYLIDSSDEMSRLERQAAIYGTAEDLTHLALRPTDNVLDVGCGAGAITRTIAQAAPQGSATGVDREARYIEYAKTRAANEKIANIEFISGNALSLPFEDNRFDVTWSKHLLQWIRDRNTAIKELVRVTKPGGRVVAANFDGFLLQHYPEDERLQSEVTQYFAAASEQIGFDNYMGRKLPTLFQEAGLIDIRISTIPDRAYSGLGGDIERTWNVQAQMDATLDLSERVFGSRDAAEDFSRRFVARFDDPGVYFHTTMFYVEGRVAASVQRSTPSLAGRLAG